MFNLFNRHKNGIRLHRVRGSVHPDPRKQATAAQAIQQMEPPALLRIPLQQHIGAPATPIVRRGDRVLKGQVIGVSQGPVSAPVHASSSGTIKAIGKYHAPHPSGLPVLTITLEVDGQEQWGELAGCDDPFNLEPDQIGELIAAAGIVGMGGATFPSAVKLGLRNRYPLHTLIVNGAECEPFLTCDDRLMRERAADIVDGIRIAMHGLQVETALVAIEKNKPEALAAMITASAIDPRIRVIPVPVRYPMGSEKHLVLALTGRETPARALTAEMGFLGHNVATLYAIQRAVRHGEPLMSRVVTVSGGAIRNPANLEVPIGSPVKQLLEFCGGLRDTRSRLLAGGPMMGQPLPTDKAPVVKGSSGILALTEAEMARKPTMPCIRCGKCVEACPCGLLPLQMAAHARAGDLQGAADLGLTDCVSCGACSYVCPAHIPLVQYFNYAKGALTEEQRSKHRQEETRRLIAAREARMEKLAAAKREAMARRKAEIAAKKAADQARQRQHQQSGDVTDKQQVTAEQAESEDVVSQQVGT